VSFIARNVVGCSLEERFHKLQRVANVISEKEFCYVTEKLQTGFAEGMAVFTGSISYVYGKLVSVFRRISLQECSLPFVLLL
jgi:hypothetical protein